MMKLKDVRFHFLDVIHIPSFLTFCSMSGISASRSDGVRRSRMVEVSFSRGNTLKRIMVAMNREQMGSAMFQPKFSIRTDDIMTPTLPRVSARTCRNTPTMQSISFYRQSFLDGQTQAKYHFPTDTGKNVSPPITPTFHVGISVLMTFTSMTVSMVMTSAMTMTMTSAMTMSVTSMPMRM